MERSGRRILLCVEPVVLEGALAKLLAAVRDDEVVEMNQTGLAGFGSEFDAAVVSVQLPDHVRARVVITLPDTRGGGGAGTVASGEVVHQVPIAGPERVIELLERYSPCPQVRVSGIPVCADTDDTRVGG